MTRLGLRAEMALWRLSCAKAKRYIGRVMAAISSAKPCEEKRNVLEAQAALVLC